MSAYFCTSCVVWAGHDVYPITESLDDLGASRTGVHHHVMYTTPSLPTMLLHMIWFPRYRFWESLYRFTYQDAYFYMKDRSNTYLLHGEFSLLLIYKSPIGYHTSAKHPIVIPEKKTNFQSLDQLVDSSPKSSTCSCWWQTLQNWKGMQRKSSPETTK